MGSFFINRIDKLMRKGKDHVFDFNNPEAVMKFRETLRKMFSKMRKIRSVKIEQLQIRSVSAETHTLKKPKNPDPMVMLHLHGGGYFSGSAEMYRSFVSDLCKNFLVNAYTIDYRLIPEHPYPAALNDAFSTYQWLLEEKSIPAKKIVILGDSAGGGLALALLHRIGKHNLPQPKGAICISPWTDLSLSNDSYVTNRDRDSFFNYTNLENAAKLYIGQDFPENPEISPIHSDFSSFPPIFLQVGSTEMLLDDSIIIAEKMKEQGVSVTTDVWEGLFHDFPIFATMPVIGRLIPEFKQARRNMKQFLDNL
jgi:acetyl esterase/lipase